MLSKGYIFVTHFICFIKVRHTERSGACFLRLTHTCSRPAGLHGFFLISLLHWPGQAAGHPGSWSQKGKGGCSKQSCFLLPLGFQKPKPLAKTLQT